MTSLSPEEIERQVEAIARQCKYEGYMQSKQWAKKRRLKLIEQNFTCERCGYYGLTNPIEIPLDTTRLHRVDR